LASLREAIATRAPSVKKALAQASPMPLLPPVTITTLSLKPKSIVRCSSNLFNIAGVDHRIFK
jgi:hypothetical protein